MTHHSKKSRQRDEARSGSTGKGALCALGAATVVALPLVWGTGTALATDAAEGAPISQEVSAFTGEAEGVGTERAESGFLPPVETPPVRAQGVPGTHGGHGYADSPPEGPRNDGPSTSEGYGYATPENTGYGYDEPARDDDRPAKSGDHGHAPSDETGYGHDEPAKDDEHEKPAKSGDHGYAAPEAKPEPGSGHAQEGQAPGYAEPEPGYATPGHPEPTPGYPSPSPTPSPTPSPSPSPSESPRPSPSPGESPSPTPGPPEGSNTPPTAPPTLAATGAGAVVPAVAGLLSAAVGGAALFVGRRRRTELD
ncbi:LPXTG cell wall anchor domain-containing protein [Nocardiopsis eucommiae]|uniref:LPXTG cell wall anchor domain-containing protein n=1 Tax=Nocardiopsis eucommiae TaxID=2831970 RepID=UPI003D721994